MGKMFLKKDTSLFWMALFLMKLHICHNYDNEIY